MQVGWADGVKDRVGGALMAHLVELDGVRPTIGEGVYLAPTAILIGNVHIGDRATVWFGAVLRGDFSRIEVGALVGMGATVLHHARVGARAVIAAGSVVAERQEVAPGMLVAGVPASERKELSGSAQRWAEIASDDYQQLRSRYLNASVVQTSDAHLSV